ncbi:AAA family ATPase [Streptomyces sp. NPDC007851]|uniref:AAA family ATPase n=1 Tax=Streptomyces sp. NPDC007851 TaxID=3155008 RepID=UPI0033FC8E13
MTLRGVVVITGVMAAGKSTVAQALAERLPRAAHVRGDVFRRMVVSGRADFTPDASAEATAQLHLRYDLSAATADAYAAAGFTAIVQDVLVGPELTAYLTRVRTRPLSVVVLAPSPEAVARREAGRSKTGYGPAWTITALDAELRRHTQPLGLWLDTSALSVEQTVAAILGGAERARVA